MPPASEDLLALTLLAESRARSMLAPRRLRLRMLTPPYAALGVGVLRVLRIRDEGETAEVVAGYDRYERLRHASR